MSLALMRLVTRYSSCFAAVARDRSQLSRGDKKLKRSALSVQLAARIAFSGLTADCR
jgi:hypothetical protein